MALPKLSLEERIRAAKWREVFKKQDVTRPLAAMSSRARQERQRLEQQALQSGALRATVDNQEQQGRGLLHAHVLFSVRDDGEIAPQALWCARCSIQCVKNVR